VFSRYVEDTPPGYTSIVVLLLLLSGFIIIALGIVGLYIGRIFDQVKGRPLFVVDEQIDGDRLGPPPDR
jgi:dolichol-phosphate mannosyltransferase